MLGLLCEKGQLMIQLLRSIGNIVLWIVAALGVVCALVWGATAMGFIKPLIVISGSMEPGIMTGDLLVDTPRDTATLEVGEVASIYSDVTGNIVTHRVVGIEASGDQWSIRMQGDANDSEDGAPYLVGDTVLQPAIQLPGVGYAIVTLTKPSVAIPLAMTLVAFLGIALLPASERRPRHRDQLETGNESHVDATPAPQPESTLVR